MSEGNRQQEYYFTKFRYTEFRLRIVSARFLKNKNTSSFIKMYSQKNLQSLLSNGDLALSILGNVLSTEANSLRQ